MDSNLNPSSSLKPAHNAHILFVEDDDLFRESMSRNLQDAGFSVTNFSQGTEALKFLAGGGNADLALLDWKMPEMTGIELFRKFKEEKIEIPVIFLTSLGTLPYEETALINGAADFIDKSKSLSIILNRIGAVVTGGKRLHSPTAGGLQETIRRGDLELCLNSNRALWKGQRVNLTLAEFKIVHHLATQIDRDVSHREIYDIVRGPGFMAGDGENGYRANVRTFIKRVRQKFGEVDDRFDRIATYSGFGYRWTDEQAQKQATA